MHFFVVPCDYYSCMTMVSYKSSHNLLICVSRVNVPLSENVLITVAH